LQTVPLHLHLEAMSAVTRHTKNCLCLSEFTGIDGEKFVWCEKLHLMHTTLQNAECHFWQVNYLA